MAEAELSTIARPYARAIFSKAIETSKGLGDWSKMLSSLSVLSSDEMGNSLLRNPRYTNDEKTKFFVSVLGDELSEQGRNFVALLAEYNRIELLPAIREIYERMKANHEKTLEVNITSAYELSKKEESTLSKALSSRLGRDISLDVSVDENLIGGAIIKAEDNVIDDSVRGKLEKIANALN